MGKRIDLHTHSTASDGSVSPRELVRHAKESGLAAVALTDHDTIDGIEEALDEGNRIGIEVIAGVETSVDFNPEMHILGYFFGDTYKNIEPTLEKLKENRAERNPKMVEKLRSLGFDISMEEVRAEAKGNIVARPHMASVLMKKGYVKSIQEAFEKYLADGKPAFVKKDKLTPEECIGAIIQAGGIPSLAHPIFLNLTLGNLDELLARLVKAGLKGIEAYYVENKGDDTGNLLRLAIKHNIIPTGGSDFHGRFKPDIKIGEGRGNLSVPYEVLERLKKV
ncbi:PHP domain-containing protein [Acetivibrio cellulolyticus]|uniref:PHP domain-containing protein n=1 Tax=Acetivibrio cellulolyticus TaxID=35830 RepID=UPI0001E30102|nr:PHP domain-containing protein [Acetivibrio cellulolyticus]